MKRAALRFVISIGIKLVIAGAAFALEHQLKRKTEAQRAEEALPETAGTSCPTCGMSLCPEPEERVSADAASSSFYEHADEAIEVVQDSDRPDDELGKYRAKHAAPESAEPTITYSPRYVPEPPDYDHEER
jgi:hypothetical protein